MMAIIPLLQTILWVGLIAFVLIRYHRILESLVSSLQRRIDSGAGIKLGPVELAELVKPLAPEQQAKKLDEEIAQIEKARQLELPGEVRYPTKEAIRALYLRAEDLVLREIAYEYQSPVGRQIQLGKNLAFDGVFAKDGVLHVVEIKYTDTRPLLNALIDQTITRLISKIEERGWKNVRIIFAVVYGSLAIDLEQERQRIGAIVKGRSTAVDVRCYHLSELAEKFGLGSKDSTLN